MLSIYTDKYWCARPVKPVATLPGLNIFQQKQLADQKSTKFIIFFFHCKKHLHLSKTQKEPTWNTW